MILIKLSFGNTYQIILCRLCVADNDKHFVVDVLVGDWLAVLVSWRLLDEGIVLDLEASVLLADDDHGLRLGVDFGGLRFDRDEFDVIFDSENLSASLGLYVFLGDVF